MTTLLLPSPADTPAPRLLVEQFLQSMRMRNCSEMTLESWSYRLRNFCDWSEERGVTCVRAVTAEFLSAYRRYLFHYRNAKTNKPLKFATQSAYLMALRSWFAWLDSADFMETNVAQHLQLPKEEERLPVAVFTAAEVETLLNATNIKRPVGLRDRAMLETFYSTAMRCGELTRLQVYDLELDRGVAKITLGKGRRDRVVPLGRRACCWINKYLHDVRPALVESTNESTLFVTEHGHPLGRTYVSAIVKRYMRAAGVDRPGSCHLLRHTTATLMLHNGADLRSLQLLLGHKRLNTTQIYTHVSITRLQEVHERTHPASSPHKETSQD